MVIGNIERDGKGADNEKTATLGVKNRCRSTGRSDDFLLTVLVSVRHLVPSTWVPGASGATPDPG